MPEWRKAASFVLLWFSRDSVPVGVLFCRAWFFSSTHYYTNSNQIITFTYHRRRMNEWNTFFWLLVCIWRCFFSQNVIWIEKCYCSHFYWSRKKTLNEFSFVFTKRERKRIESEWMTFMRQMQRICIGWQNNSVSTWNCVHVKWNRNCCAVFFFLVIFLSTNFHWTLIAWCLSAFNG